MRSKIKFSEQCRNVGNAFMHSGDFGTKSHCRQASIISCGNQKMRCIFCGTDKSVPYVKKCVECIPLAQTSSICYTDFGDDNGVSKTKVAPS